MNTFVAKGGLIIALLVAAGLWAQTEAPQGNRYPVDRRHGSPDSHHVALPAAAAQAKAAAPRPRYEMAQYLNIQSAAGPSYSPVSDEIAYLTNITGVNQVFKVASNAAQPRQLTAYEDRVMSVHWSPRGDTILFAKDQGGNERAQLFLIHAPKPGAPGAPLDMAGGNVQALTSAPKAIHSFGDFSRDGKMICYSSNERSERTFDVYVMDLATHQPRRAFTSPDERNYMAEDLSPDGKYVLAARENTNMDNDLFLIEVASGQARLLTEHTGEALYTHPAWAADGSGFYLAANEGRDKAALAFYDVKAGKLKYLEDEAYEIDGSTGIAIDRGGKHLAYASNHDGVSVLKVRNLKTGKVSEVRALPQGVIGRPSFSGDGSRVAFAFTSAARASDVWQLDLGTMQPTQVTHSSLAGIPPESFVSPQAVSYQSFDGTAIPAFLYLPAGASKAGALPAIVSVHGGPEAQERIYFNPVYQYFLNRGYAILATNIRGSAGFGKKYLHMDDYKKRLDAIQDVALAATYLKSSGFIDPGKIAVMGGSYGGFMTLAQVTMNPGL